MSMRCRVGMIAMTIGVLTGFSIGHGAAPDRGDVPAPRVAGLQEVEILPAVVDIEALPERGERRHVVRIQGCDGTPRWRRNLVAAGIELVLHDVGPVYRMAGHHRPDTARDGAQVFAHDHRLVPM